MKLLFFPLICVLLAAFLKAIYSLKKRDALLTPILAWLVGLGFFLLAPLTIIVLNNGYQAPNFYDVDSRHADVNLSLLESIPPFFMIWSALFLSFVTVILFLPKLDKGWQRREVFLNDGALKRAIYLSVGLMVLDWVITVYLVGGVAEFLVSHWYLRADDMSTRLGSGYVLYTWLSQANQIVFTAAAVLFTHSQARKGAVNWKFSAFLVLVFLFQVVFSGNRIFLALYLVSLVVSCWLYGRRKMVIALVLSAPAFALIFSAWSYLRAAPAEIAERSEVYRDSDLGNRTVTVLMDSFDGSDTVLLFHIINDFGDKFSYLYGSTYLRAVSFVIPRSIYPEKAQDFTIQLAEKYEPGSTTSLAATQLGELFANFGPLSVLLLPLFTLMIMYASETHIKWLINRTLTSSVFFVLIIWAVRSTFEDNFITFLAALAIIRALRLEGSPQSTNGGLVPKS